jgi:hypothetical protein
MENDLILYGDYTEQEKIKMKNDEIKKLKKINSIQRKNNKIKELEKKLFDIQKKLGYKELFDN